MEFFMSDSNQDDLNTNFNLNGKNSCQEQPAAACDNEVTLEMVMKELQNMKSLLNKVIKNHEITTNDLTELKATCKIIETSVKKIEDKDHGSGVFTHPMQSEPLTTETCRSTPTPLFGTNVVNIEDEEENRSAELPSADAVMDVEVMNTEGSWSQTMMIADEALRPLLPTVWMPKTVSGPEGNEAVSIPHSDFRRTHAGMLSPGAVNPTIPKRLFQTPSPSSSGKGKRSNSKGKNKVVETGSKKPRHSGNLIPKGAKLNFRPTNDMDLVPKEAQACAYLFQKTKDAKVMEERLVKAGELSATREELMCLLPTRKVTDLVITLMAESVREAQHHLSSQAVWCLPPSFEVDLDCGMQIPMISQKYCARWMPPYTTLKFIYVPLKTSSDHWYLMIIHLEEKTIYHLDSNCPVVASPWRKLRIKKLATLLYHLVSDPNFSLSFRNQRIDFMNFEIVDGRGIPCTGNSDNSGVWVLDWMSMEHFFIPDLLVGLLKENEVRMKSAATLLLGGHNELRAVVEENTKAFINTAPTVQPPCVDN